MVVSDDLVAVVLEAIELHGRTDTIGDGKIFVLDVAKAVRIRTGEKDDHAI